MCSMSNLTFLSSPMGEGLLTELPPRMGEGLLTEPLSPRSETTAIKHEPLPPRSETFGAQVKSKPSCNWMV